MRTFSRRAFVRRANPAVAAEAEAVANAAEGAVRRAERQGEDDGRQQEHRLRAAETFVSAKLSEYYALTSRLEGALEQLHHGGADQPGGPKESK